MRRSKVVIDKPYYNEANTRSIDKEKLRVNIKPNLHTTERTQHSIEKSLSKIVIHDIDEDYETLYKDGWRPDPEDYFKDIPVGICLQMCPSIEAQEREQQRRLHHYETVPGTKPPKANLACTVKQFKRSCVGTKAQGADVLRPWSVLKKTLHYLLLDIATKDDNWLLICDFVYDRLCAIRQDMIIQRIQGKRCVEILEGSVRFLIYSLFRLTNTLRDDDKSDKMIIRLVESNGGPLKGLVNYEMEILREMKLTMQNLRDCLKSLLKHYEHFVPNSHFRPIFEAINLIINNIFLRGSQITETSFLKDAKSRDKHELFKHTYDMFLDHSSGFHITALKKIPKLSNEPLLIITYAAIIAPLQVRLILLLRKAYATSKCSLEFLASMICPEWMESDNAKRLRFAKFVAIQNGIYDSMNDRCDFNLSKITAEEMKLMNSSDTEAETKLYALHLITGRNWSYFQETFYKGGVEFILDPSLPKC